MRIAALDIGGTSIKSGIWTGGLAEEVREEATEAKKGGPAVMAKAKEILPVTEGLTLSASARQGR